MFQKVSGIQDFMHKKGTSLFSVEIFGLTVLKFFEDELFYVSDCFSYRKVLCIKGLSHDFLTKQFCLTVPNYFLVEPFSVSENFWYRKMLRI